MLQKSRGIVLHKVRYSENSLIVKFYTRQLGLLSIMVHGAGKAKSRNKSTLLQPLSLLDLELDFKEKRNIHHLKETRLAYLYRDIHQNISKSSILLFLNEVLYKSVKEEEANQPLFDFIYNSLIRLDEMQEKYQNFHLDFLIKLSGFLGFNPMNNYSENDNPYFHLQEGYFAPHPGPPGEAMDKKDSFLFYCFLAEDYRNISLNSFHRNNLLDQLLKYYSHHIPHFPEIKSHRILKQVLG